MNNKYFTVCGLLLIDGRVLLVRHTYGTAKDRILLPGVGAFGDAAEKLRAFGFNLRKQEIFYRVFNILGKGEFPAAVKRAPNMWLQMRRR